MDRGEGALREGGLGPVLAAHDRRRRLGGAQDAAAGVRDSVRRVHVARLGHDRADAARHGLPAQELHEGLATIDAEGYVQITDRTKDLIKSGGEWISSVDVENMIMAHPRVLEAAVIAVPHPKWVERPLACVVPKPGATIEAEEIIEFLRPKLAKWALPDDVAVIEAVPKTSVGKFDKKVLRERFKDWTPKDA